MTILGSGSFASAVTWLVSRRKRNNDFLGELQNSINVLSENYTKTLDELVTVKKQNAELLVQVSKLQSEVAELKKENSGLLAKVAELKKLINSK